MRLYLAALALAGFGTSASAYTVLGFEGVNPTYPSAPTQILNFYNGGLSGAGTSGANYGVNFDANAVAVCLNSMMVTCSNASTGGLVPTSNRGALGLAASGVTVLDLASAYTGAIGFRYAQRISGSSFIAAYDGVGGTGTQLVNLTLTGSAPGCPAYSAPLCTFTPGGLGILTNVRSVVFGGIAGQVVFDDITFGAGNDPLPPPALPAPEPASWLLMMLGFGLIGGSARHHRALSQPFDFAQD